MSFHIPGSCGDAQRAERRAAPSRPGSPRGTGSRTREPRGTHEFRAERRAAPSRPGSPRGTGSRTREPRGAILLPIFQLVEQVQ